MPRRTPLIAKPLAMYPYSFKNRTSSFSNFINISLTFPYLDISVSIPFSAHIKRDICIVIWAQCLPQLGLVLSRSILHDARLLQLSCV